MLKKTKSVEIKGNPRELGKLMTLAQVQDASAKVRLLRANLFDVECRSLPLTPDEFTDIFPAEKHLFSTEPDNENRITNLSFGASVDCPLLVMGVGILLVTEGFGLSVPGIMVDTPAALEDTPCNSGCASATQDNAVFQWGLSTWSLRDYFATAHRLQMFLCRNYRVFDEWVRDVGLAGVTNQYVGAGHALRGVMDLIRQTNDAMTTKGIAKQFIPQNVVTAADGTSECIGAPTAEVLWGAGHTPGLANRIFPIDYPMLLVPGMPINIQFTRDDSCECPVTELARDTVLDVAQGPTKPSAAFNEALACGVGSSAVFTVNGGCFQLGIVLAGREVSSLCCLELLNDIVLSGNPMLTEIYRNSNVQSYLGGLASSARKDFASLGGLPDKDIDAMLSNVRQHLLNT